LCVLVVEDNIIHMTLIKQQLIEMGIQMKHITCAFDGDQAVKEVEQNVNLNSADPKVPLFSIIITDYHVPSVCGI
jgi:CheY-like chemotaxis protein